MDQELELKNYIVEESDKLFNQYGFKSVTMDDIAKHLGMSKKTIYQNFADKNELVSILIEKKLGGQTCKMEECRAHSENAVHEIFIAIAGIHEHLSALNPKLFYDLQKYHPRSWLRFRDFKEQTLNASIRQNLERGIKEGVYRPDINIEVLTQLRIDHSNIILNQDSSYTMNKYNIAQVMAEVTEHFLYGVCSARGLELMEKYKKELENNQLKK